MPTYRFRLNGRQASVDTWDPNEPLLYALRDSLGLHGPKFGCGVGQCGACTVHVDGKATRSCSVALSRVVWPRRDHARRPRHAGTAGPGAGRVHRRTGGTVRLLHQRNDHDHQGAAGPEPETTLAQAKQALAGNICRCGTHTRILRAVMRAAGTRA